MRSVIGHALMALMLGVPLQAAHAPKEAPLTIRIEQPGDTTTLRIPLSWMEMTLDLLKVLNRDRVDTSGNRINLDNLKAALMSFRGGFLELLGDSERIYMYVGHPDMRCPCLEVTGQNRQGREKVWVNLDVARHILQHSEIKDFSPKEQDRLLHFLERSHPGESMEIANSRGDTVWIRMVARPGEAGRAGSHQTER